MVIRVLSLTGAADTQQQGAAVYDRLVDALKTQPTVLVSFDGIDIATSSFVNMAFVRLLDHMSLQDIKQRVRVVQSTRQINSMIKRRLEQQGMVAA